MSESKVCRIVDKVENILIKSRQYSINTLSSSTRRTGMQMQWSGELARCSPGSMEPATQDSRPPLPAVLTPKT